MAVCFTKSKLWMPILPPDTRLIDVRVKTEEQVGGLPTHSLNLDACFGTIGLVFTQFLPDRTAYATAI